MAPATYGFDHGVPAVRWLIVAAVGTRTGRRGAYAVRCHPAGGERHRGCRPGQSSIRAARATSAGAGQVRAARVGGGAGRAARPSAGSPSAPRGADATCACGGAAPTNWRVDRLRGTGESDLVRDGGLIVQLELRGRRVSFTPYSAIRLPGDSDVVPVALARRMLAGATPDELAGCRPAHRRAQRRRPAPGAAEKPLDDRGVGHLGGRRPRAAAARRRVRRGRKRPGPLHAAPPADLDAPSGTTPTSSSVLDRFSRGRRPRTTQPAPTPTRHSSHRTGSRAAATRRRLDFGAVGVYGRGPTASWPSRCATPSPRGLRDQLRKSTTRERPRPGIEMRSGRSRCWSAVAGASFLLAGTVTPEALEAAEGLPAWNGQTR